MDPRPESHLFLYPPSSDRNVLPHAVFIKVAGLGYVLCKIERMEEQDIAKMHTIAVPHDTTH